MENSKFNKPKNEMEVEEDLLSGVDSDTNLHKKFCTSYEILNLCLYLFLSFRSI